MQRCHGGSLSSTRRQCSAILMLHSCLPCADSEKGHQVQALEKELGKHDRTVAIEKKDVQLWQQKKFAREARAQELEAELEKARQTHAENMLHKISQDRTIKETNDENSQSQFLCSLLLCTIRCCFALCSHHDCAIFRGC